MERNFKRVLSELNKVRGYKNLLKILNEIKRAVNSNRENVLVTRAQNFALLRTGGFLKHVRNYLLPLRKRIIKVYLQIFASCTLGYYFTEEMILDNNILFSLLHDILIRFPDDESVHRKILEILGNVSQHNEKWADFIVGNTEFLYCALDWLNRVSADRTRTKRNYSEPILMAVLKFLRIILDGSPKMKISSTVENFHLLQVVGTFLVEVTIKMKNNRNVLQNLVKLVDNHFLRFIEFGDSIKGTKGGESIIYLCGRMQLFVKRMPSLMKNFIKINELECRPRIEDICDWIIYKLEEDLNIEDSKEVYVGHISCLCFMLLYTCNERHRRYLPQLMKVLEFVKKPSYADVECFILIIMTYEKYSCEDASVAKDLLDSNLIQTLVEKLKWIAGQKTLTLNFQHKVPQKRERWKFDRLPGRLENCNHPNPMFNEEYSCVMRRIVTSSNEEYEPSRPSSVSNTKSASSTEKAVNGENCLCLAENIFDIMKNVLLTEVVSLLWAYIGFFPGVTKLASEEVITALLNASLFFQAYQPAKDDETFKLVRNIIKSPMHMVHLMGTPIVEKVYDMSVRKYMPWCCLCAKIKYFGLAILQFFESTAHYPIGDQKIADGLLTLKDERKVRLVTSIPYISRNETLLGIYLLEYQGLNVLLQQIEEGSTLKESSIKALHILVSNRFDKDFLLHIAKPRCLSAVELVPVRSATAKEGIVTFKLDDGFSVQADLKLLMEKSWYFSTLLNGNFMESKETEVALHDVTNQSLRFLLDLLKNPDKIDQLVMQHDLDALLDVVALTDRLMESKLCSSLMRSITKHRMTSKTVATIYRWSIESGVDLLRAEAVVFALVDPSENDARIAMFDNLLGLGYTKKLIRDIRKILEGYLGPLVQELSDDDDDESSDDESSDDESSDDESSDDEPSDDESSDDESSDDESSDDESSDDESSDDESSDDESPDDEITDNEITDDEITDDEITDDEITDDEINDDETPD